MTDSQPTEPAGTLMSEADRDAMLVEIHEWQRAASIQIKETSDQISAMVEGLMSNPGEFLAKLMQGGMGGGMFG